MDQPRYEPWCLAEARGWPWGIRDNRTGVNVLGHFLPEVTGAVFCNSKEEAEALIAQGRQWEFSPKAGRLVRAAMMEGGQ